MGGSQREPDSLRSDQAPHEARGCGVDEQSAKLQKRSGVGQKALDQCKSSINTAEVGTSKATTPQWAPRLYREHC